jgi:hypothetical protein
MTNVIHSAGSVGRNTNAIESSYFPSFDNASDDDVRKIKEIWLTSIRRKAKATRTSIFAGKKPVTPFKVYVDKTESVRKMIFTLDDRTNDLSTPRKKKSKPNAFSDKCSPSGAREFTRSATTDKPTIPSTTHNHIPHTSLAGKPIADDKKNSHKT